MAGTLTRCVAPSEGYLSINERGKMPITKSGNEKIVAIDKDAAVSLNFLGVAIQKSMCIVCQGLAKHRKMRRAAIDRPVRQHYASSYRRIHPALILTA